MSRPIAGPAANFGELDLPEVSVSNQVYWRMTHLDFSDSPLHFGRSGRNRFDDPRKTAYGVCYAAHDFDGAFMESFARGGVGRSLGLSTLISRRTLSERAVRTFEVKRGESLALLDVRGAVLAQMGTDARLWTTIDYAVSQAWSLAIHDHPKHFDGIIYSSRHDPQNACVALFERASPRLQIIDTVSLAQSTMARVAATLQKYNLSLI